MTFPLRRAEHWLRIKLTRGDAESARPLSIFPFETSGRKRVTVKLRGGGWSSCAGVQQEKRDGIGGTAVCAIELPRNVGHYRQNQGNRGPSK